MNRYLVTYDLDLPGPQDYDKIIDELKRLKAKEVLESIWVLRSGMTARQLLAHLKNFISVKTDRLLVVLIVTRGFAGWRLKAKISEM